LGATKIPIPQGFIGSLDKSMMDAQPDVLRKSAVFKINESLSDSNFEVQRQ
jgi:hypothetical protein